MWLCGEFGREVEQENQDLEGEGVGNGERRKVEPWNEEKKQLQKSSILRVNKLAISATCKELQYGTSFSNE